MPIPTHLLAQFSEESYYHVICKCIEGKKLFYNDDDRFFFLKRYNDFLYGFVDTYAYTLIDNHVHWLIKTKKEADMLLHLNSKETVKLTATHKNFLAGNCSFHELLEQQYNRFFISYALTLNKGRETSGHLFNRPFKRVEITDDAHLTQVIVYIHANIQKHGLLKDFRLFKWSSYQAILSSGATHIVREEVLDWFGGRDKFIGLHDAWADEYYAAE